MANLNRLNYVPNQNAQCRFQECVPITIAGIVGNISNVALDPGFGYAAYFDLAGLMPSDTGTDPYGSFLAQCYRGSLPTASETFDALSTSELMEANFAAYTDIQKQLALHFKMPGVRELYSYSDILWWIKTYQQPVALAVRWHDVFDTTDANGFFPEPTDAFREDYHCITVYDATPDFLTVEPHLGVQYGKEGYGYMRPDVFGQVFQQSFAFDPNANPAITALWVRFYQLQHLFSIIAAQYAKRNTPAAQK